MADTPKRIKIDVDDIGIGEVIQRHRLSVPINQREYSWEEKQVTDLFSDFRKSIEENEPAYFLGTIALTGPDRKTPEVTDGQQRLATTSILLAAIRDHFDKNGNSGQANWVEGEYLTVYDPDQDRHVARMTLNVDNRAYFSAHIASRPDTLPRKLKPKGVSNERLAEAMRLAREHVKNLTHGYPQAEATKRLVKWVKWITDKALVIVLYLPDDLNAFQMFETLNDRGLKTSQVDIIKNFLFKKAGQQHMPRMQPVWSQAMALLDSLDIDDVALQFLRHFVMTKHGLTREKELFTRVEKTVLGEQDAIEFIDDVKVHAADYVAILSPTDKKWNGYPQTIRRSVQTLRELRAGQILPLMLAVARHFPKRDADAAFHHFVNWTVRFLVAGGGRGGTLEEAYAARAKDVAEKTIADTAGLFAALVGVLPTDGEFETAFATARQSKNYLARYYLRALEMKQKNQPEPEWVPNEDTIIVNLEHVMPENPGDEWPDLDPETAATLHTRIGNMVLLQAKKNSIVGNSGFEKKKDVFKASSYALTKQVARYKDWGKTAIDDRQRKLAALAVKTWPLEVS